MFNDDGAKMWMQSSLRTERWRLAERSANASKKTLAVSTRGDVVDVILKNLMTGMQEGSFRMILRLSRSPAPDVCVFVRFLVPSLASMLSEPHIQGEVVYIVIHCTLC